MYVKIQICSIFFIILKNVYSKIQIKPQPKSNCSLYLRELCEFALYLINESIMFGVSGDINSKGESRR